MRIVAFWVDILSPGKPSLFHWATVASSVSINTGSKPNIMGISTWFIKLQEYFFSHTNNLIIQVYTATGDLLVAEERHPEVVQQLSPVFLREGAGVRDESCSQQDVSTEGCLLLVILSHWVGPAHILTLKRTHTHTVTFHVRWKPNQGGLKCHGVIKIQTGTTIWQNNACCVPLGVEQYINPHC